MQQPRHAPCLAPLDAGPSRRHPSEGRIQDGEDQGVGVGIGDGAVRDDAAVSGKLRLCRIGAHGAISIKLRYPDNGAGAVNLSPVPQPAGVPCTTGSVANACVRYEEVDCSEDSSVFREAYCCVRLAVSWLIC